MSDISYTYGDFVDCPVCGAKDGNCGGNQTWDGRMIEFKKEVKDPNATFSVPRRVYEEKMVGRRMSKRLLYRPGDRITLQEAERLGFLKRRAK